MLGSHRLGAYCPASRDKGVRWLCVHGVLVRCTFKTQAGCSSLIIWIIWNKWIIGNSLKYTFAKNYNNRWSSDKAIAKIKQCSFLPHMVVMFVNVVLDCLGLHCEISLSEMLWELVTADSSMSCVLGNKSGRGSWITSQVGLAVVVVVVLVVIIILVVFVVVVVLVKRRRSRPHRFHTLSSLSLSFLV